jgi:hypothetical protein
MKSEPSRRWDQEALLVGQLAACVAVLAFFYYLRRGDVLLYGDAVAHINIARRVFDSRTPGLLQLGTVWLPLPHLLMIPFLLSDSAWQSGAGGSIPSLIAYVVSVVGVFRLVRDSLRSRPGSEGAAGAAAWGAAAIYAANPNLIYLETTALTEPTYLAWSLWSVVHCSAFLRQLPAMDRKAAPSASLMKCGLCLAGACLTRYDGWFLALTITIAVGWAAVRHSPWRDLRWPVAKFVLLAAAAPALWLAYNAAVYSNPLEFAYGPFSARAIEQKASAPGSPPHPGTHDLPVAASYFLKAGESTLLESGWHRLWLLLALVGSALTLLAPWMPDSATVAQPAAPTSTGQASAGGVKPVANGKTRPEFSPGPLWPLLLLWTPLPFYALSIAYGGVPIFLPVWWPFSLYNTRYGIELLPAFAVFAALAGYFLSRRLPGGRYRAGIAAGIAVLTIASYISVWHDEPISNREARINSRTRLSLEHGLASFLNGLRSNSVLLMYLGDHVGALQDARIPLRRVIYEGNHRSWKQPADPDGLWERALADPARYADYVITVEGDPVARGVRRQGLVPEEVLHVAGLPRATIYSTHPVER